MGGKIGEGYLVKVIRRGRLVAVSYAYSSTDKEVQL